MGSSLFKIVTTIAVLAASIVTFSDFVISQEHFIGESQAVNRVIQLRSKAQSNIPKKAIDNVTSRGNRIARQTTPMTQVKTKYTLQPVVPRALQDQRGPVVEEATMSPNSSSSQFMATPVKTAPFKAAPAKTVPFKATPIQAAPSKRTTPMVSSSWSKKPATSKASSARSTSKEIVTKRSNMISTEITSPRYININETAQIKIDVHNKGDDAVENVKLIATIPTNARLTSSSPQATHTAGQNYEFSIQRIGGEDVRQIVLNLVPTQKVPLNIETQVRVDSTQKTLVSVRQPNLSLSLTGPLQANIGQTLVHTLVVTNTGDGVARDVRLDALYPLQIKSISQSGGPVIRSIEPGKTVKVKYESKALNAGPVNVRVSANANGVEAQQTSFAMNIYQPELRISAIGPKLNFVERDGIYTIKVENTGEVDVTGIKVALAVPQGMKVTTISRQANVDADNGILNWTFDKISAKSLEQIQLKATALEEGQQTCNIMVSSNETREKEIVLGTKVITRADLSVRIRNISGPVQVGGKAEFVIDVENKGSRRASDVNVRVLLPETLMAVKGMDVDRSENAIIFGEPQISPGEKATFKFSVVGVAAGEQVVRSVLEVGGTERKVIAEDTVFVYEVDEARVSESLSPVVPR